MCPHGGAALASLSKQMIQVVTSYFLRRLFDSSINPLAPNLCGPIIPLTDKELCD